MRRFTLTAGLLGFLAVALGAFGAHALKQSLQNSGFLEAWQTAVHYHLVHAGLLLALSLFAVEHSKALLFAARAWTTGILLFSGSLYVMALTGIKALGMITPLGGLCLLAGWAAISVWGLGQRALPSQPKHPQMNT